MSKVYIVGCKRTALGSFGGRLSTFSATALGSMAITAALEQAKVDPKRIEEVYFGNVLSANLGQAPARQAALGAGISENTPCTTVNKVCSSGMKAVALAAQTIQLGQADLMVAGGMESMSQTPYYADSQRFGSKYGNRTLIDGLAKDGLTDVYNACAMGLCGDQTAQTYHISREEQDAYAIQSYKRAQAAADAGKFADEITKVSIPQRKGDPIILSEDEDIRKVKYDKIPNLKPTFSKDGTVTPANASNINDGAAALILASAKAVEEHNLTPLAEIISYADAAHDPMLFTTAPAKATPLALKRAGWDIKDIDLFEVNEAFAVVPLVYAQLLDLSLDTINIHGGAVAMGHPLGASGARILTTLLYALKQESKNKGLAAICNGGGGASAMIIQNV